MTNQRLCGKWNTQALIKVIQCLKETHKVVIPTDQPKVLIKVHRYNPDIMLFKPKRKKHFIWTKAFSYTAVCDGGRLNVSL